MYIKEEIYVPVFIFSKAAETSWSSTKKGLLKSSYYVNLSNHKSIAFLSFVKVI